MIFQIKHTRQKFFGESFLKVVLVFLLILIPILIFGFFSPAGSLVSNILSPFFKTGNSFYKTFNQIPNFFSDKNKLIEENTKLSTEIENLYRNIVDYESVKYENQKLRSELGLRPVGNFITTSIIAKSPQIPLDSLFIDKGVNDGVNNGDFVLTSERILIGKITKANANRATVVLNSFAGVVSYGFVARTGEPVEIKGEGGGSIGAKVPIDFNIEVGDKIMVNDSLAYLVAVVGVIEEDRSSGFKDIMMSMPINISKINIVFTKPVISE